ncbi:MAG: M28 family peptidase [Bacillota bacterium]|nr:M28 family peptidase [Bacillota bacterium]
MFRRSVIMLLVVLMVFSFALPAFAQSTNTRGQSAAAFDQKIIRNLDVNRAMDHLYYLTKEIGTRPGGMPNEKLAADYIADYFESIGYEPWVQEFSIGNQHIGTITVHDGEQWFGQGEWGFNEWHGTVWETGAGSRGPYTSVSGYVVDCGSGGVNEWPAEVEGNIALVQRGTAFTTLVSRAQNAGATGLLIYSVVGSRGQYGQTFSPNVTTSIPVLGLALSQGMWLKEMMEEFPVYLDIETQLYSNLISQNVIAIKPAAIENAPIVVIGGHYDSVVGAPGANDNGSGVVILMELARVLKEYDTDEYELRFAVWGSEERGLVGANRYVQWLSTEDRNRHVANYNLDMVATSEYERAPTLFLETVDGLPNIVTDTSLAAVSRLGYTNVVQSRFGSSDHVPFHNAGIPATMFIWLGGAGTPQNYTIERYYHTPQDTIEENICVDRLDMVMKIAGAAVFDLVRKQVPAFEKAAIVYREYSPAELELQQDPNPVQ